MRLGLCCAFTAQPIVFRTTTVRACDRLERQEALAKLARLCTENAAALMAALKFCATHDIGCFRINSRVWPLKTHGAHGYDIEELPGSMAIRERFLACGAFAREHHIRTVFHPDQFVVLSSPRHEVTAASLAELDYQAEVAEWVGADVLNIHGGGAYGNKATALETLRRNLSRLSDRARVRLTFENDDRVFTPSDLLPLCQAEAIPLVYDVHHHRCHPDGMSEEEATVAAYSTWSREPLCHISSPLGGWHHPQSRRHHDYIDIQDFPRFWTALDMTVEVEAKAKELAVAQLQRQLRR